MQWKPKIREKREVTHVVCLWMLVVFLTGIVTSCSLAKGDSPEATFAPTVTPDKKSPVMTSPTIIPQPTAPHILSGDLPSFMLGKGIQRQQDSHHLDDRPYSHALLGGA